MDNFTMLNEFDSVQYNALDEKGNPGPVLQTQQFSMPIETILQKINESALHFLAPLSLEETYQTIAKESVKLIDGIDSSILLAEPKTRNLHVVYSTTKKNQNFKMRRRGYAYTSYTKRRAFVITVEDFAPHHKEVLKEGIKSILFIPLYYQRKSMGTLCVRSKEESSFLSEEFDALKVFGSMASLAIRKAQLYNETAKALKIRDLFMSMAAHELKTPLTSINGYIQLLHSKMKDTGNREAGWVQQLQFESNRLTNLIDELMQTHSIKSGKLQFSWQECSIREILRQAIMTFQFSYPARLVFFDDEATDKVVDTIIGDFTKLRQAFDNLLDNAGKFSALESPIKVTLRFEEPFFVISIQDQGSGIASQDLPHIFDEFYKSSENSTLEGMGLGLFLVKSIVTQHHGKISVTSSPKKGTTMEVRLRKVEV
jgi:signal transduction histidine kinase